MLRVIIERSGLHEGKIEGGEVLDPHEVYESAQVALNNLLSKYSFEELGGEIEVLLSLQQSREDDFLTQLDPERLEELKPTIEMILPMKHGAVGGNENLLEYAERQLDEAGLHALAMSYQEGVSFTEIDRMKNRIESWEETVEILRKEVQGENSPEPDRFTAWLNRIQQWKAENWGS